MNGYFFNHTRKLFANGEIDIANLRVMLLKNYSVDLSDDNISQLDRNEVMGNGWSEGGELIQNTIIEIENTNQSVLRGADISVTADGGDIGPANGAVIYQDSEGFEYPLFYMEFGDQKISSEGEPFEIVWSVNGIHRWVGLNG